VTKTEENGNHSAVKTPETLMSEVNYKQTPQTEKDKMTTLVERYQNLDPVRIVELGDKVIKFCTPNLMTLDRVWNLFHAEPVTIEWILNFKENETLFDIGANVGTYGIFASIMRYATVFAFEPESQNFGLLTKNILYNNLSERMTAWPVAISDEQKFSLLNLWGFRAGNSHHFFDESLNFKLEKENFPFVQGAVSTTIDSLVEAQIIPIPDHIKIDVDGIEDKVVNGAWDTLSHQGVQSILIELNTNLEQHRLIPSKLKDIGFSYDIKQVQESMRTDPRHAGISEHVFRR
jgi:FkbM family methyltransferase